MQIRTNVLIRASCNQKPSISKYTTALNLLRGQTKCDLLLIMMSRRSLTLIVALVGLVAVGLAQNAGNKDWTASEDHQNMMDQLGIKALRPGPSGNETAANHANYDEAT